MKLSAGILFLLLAIGAPSLGQEATTKQVCLSSFGMKWGTSEEAQRNLASLAKREAVGELFGEMLWSTSELTDLSLTRDEIQTFSGGFVRVRGAPRFYNGAGFGELCVAVDLYVLNEDVVRLKPRTVSKKVCIADPRLSSGDLRALAERQAQVQAVRDFEPGIRNVNDEFVLRLLHEARIEEAGFVAETLAYCATARGVVFPIEVLVATKNPQEFGMTSAEPQRGADASARRQVSGARLEDRSSLLWTERDNGADITWDDAKSYCESLTLGGLDSWRLPSLSELRGLYDAGSAKKYKTRANVELSSSWVWSGDLGSADGISMWDFSFSTGEPLEVNRRNALNNRAVCVRRSGR